MILRWSDLKTNIIMVTLMQLVISVFADWPWFEHLSVGAGTVLIMCILDMYFNHLSASAKNGSE